VFDCRLQCGISYSKRKGDWKRLHERSQWRDLAVSVLQRLSQHYSYFMLAEAAKGMGLKQAAATYYNACVGGR